MSSWDAPTGSWDSRHEPDESGRPEDQGYEPGEPTDGYRTMRGGEGRPRAGRRGLPGYEQAENHNQGTAGYDQGYGQESGYGQQSGHGSGQGYGPDTGPLPGYGSAAGGGPSGGQMVRYGQRPAGEPG